MDNSIILAGNTKALQGMIEQAMLFHQIIESKDVGTIYAYSNDLESTRRKGKPKVTLYFLEDTDFKKTGSNPSTPQGRRRVEGVIRFRLMQETTQTFSKANATTLANKIKQVFGSNNGFVWSKGKTMYPYCDWDNGYQFQLLCRNKVEAKRIITSVLSLQGHTPDWINFSENENDQKATKYPETPGTQLVMGESLPIPLSRPNVDVRFQYAYVKLSGVLKPVNLYDRTHKLVEPLVI